MSKLKRLNAEEEYEKRFSKSSKKKGLRVKDDLELLKIIVTEDPILQRKVQRFIESNFSHKIKR